MSLKSSMRNSCTLLNLSDLTVLIDLTVLLVLLVLLFLIVLLVLLFLLFLPPLLSLVTPQYIYYLCIQYDFFTEFAIASPAAPGSSQSADPVGGLRPVVAASVDACAL